MSASLELLDCERSGAPEEVRLTEPTLVFPKHKGIQSQFRLIISQLYHRTMVTLSILPSQTPARQPRARPNLQPTATRNTNRPTGRPTRHSAPQQTPRRTQQRTHTTRHRQRERQCAFSWMLDPARSYAIPDSSDNSQLSMQDNTRLSADNIENDRRVYSFYAILTSGDSYLALRLTLVLALAILTFRIPPW